MSAYLMTAASCDDQTVSVIELTAREALIADRIAAVLTADGGGCKPTLTVQIARSCPECDGSYSPAYDGDECKTCNDLGVVPQ